VPGELSCKWAPNAHASLHCRGQAREKGVPVGRSGTAQGRARGSAAPARAAPLPHSARAPAQAPAFFGHLQPE
jgi:hypothetical protein